MINNKAILGIDDERLVAIYGRVSTEHEAQTSALENQMQWYEDQVKKHPNWTIVGRYVDEGITGTQASKRPEFLRMLEDAKNGKMDLIVTREVSRFARNTLEALKITRELLDIGVEVYFVNDNIKTSQAGDDFKLTLFSSLAQNESQKTSERVKAGQYISRQKKTIYGNGNILGYDRLGKTYVINKEQAETVRMIYDFYLAGEMGASKISNKLTKLGRKNASGIVKWNASSVLRILSNQTYMGYMAYGKSYTKDFLSQKRCNVHDAAKYELVKCDFEPIVSEEEWHKVQEIKSSRNTPSIKKAMDTRKANLPHPKPMNKDLWCNKLECSCGAHFRKSRWHKNKNNIITYGYECYNQLNNGSAKKRAEQGADTEGYCDVPMIADWKLEVMAKKIMEEIWLERITAVTEACNMLQQYYRSDDAQDKKLQNLISAINKLESKKENLIGMRMGNEISKEEFLDFKEKVDADLEGLKKQYDEVKHLKESDKNDSEYWDTIQSTLSEIIDFNKPTLDRDLLWMYIKKVVPIDKTHFKWFLNLGNDVEAVVDMVVEGGKINHSVYFDIDETKTDSQEQG